MENYDWENDFDDGDDNNDGAGHFSGKNVVLFAIYGGEGMHQDDSGEEGKTLFQKAVMAAVDTYKVWTFYDIQFLTIRGWSVKHDATIPY